MVKSPKSKAQRIRARLRLIFALLMACGISLTIGSDLFVKDRILQKEIHNFGFLLTLAFVPLMHLVSAETKAAKLTLIQDGPLLGRVAAIGTAANCAVDKVYVVEPQEEVQKVMVTLYGRMLFINRRSINDVSDSALDFGIAYELSETFFRQRVTFYVVGLVGGLGALAMIKLYGPEDGIHSLPIGWSKWILEGAIGVMVAMAAIVMVIARLDSRREIRSAYRIVPNQAAAREWFEKSIQEPNVGATAKKLRSSLKDLEAAAARGRPRSSGHNEV